MRGWRGHWDTISPEAGNMPNLSQDHGLFFIFFVYGLAFLGMGIAIALESRRTPVLLGGRALHLLAGFGLLHGTHEWLESYLLQARSLNTAIEPWIAWLRLGLLICSFGSLFLFALLNLRMVPGIRFGWRWPALLISVMYLLAILVPLTRLDWQIDLQELLDAMARYLLAVPGGVLAGIALYAQGHLELRKGRLALAGDLRITALGFWFYAATQLFVHPLDLFPARFINQATFLALVGFPIQIVRALVAVLITLSVLHVIERTESERQLELAAAQQARLAALEQQENLRRQLLRHTVQAQEDERARIARELHDETAQVLSAFSLELATLRMQLGRAPRNIRMLDHLQELTRQMSQGIYHLVHDLRPAHLDDLGLPAALKYLLEQDCCPKGLDVAFETAGTQQRLDPLRETVLFRVAQEALNNVARHSGARQAQVRLSYEPDKVVMKVADQGRGFDPAENFHPPRGWGLAGMRERVELMGGELKIMAAPGKGTTVEITLPILAQPEKGVGNGNHQADARG